MRAGAVSEESASGAMPGAAFAAGGDDARDRSACIAALNDRLRQTLRGGRVVITPGVSALEEAARARLLAAVQAFSAFTPDNDPYGERDFGSVRVDDTTFFWKIDYYDAGLRGGSPDPTDAVVTSRVLTIMRADEY